MLSCFNHFWLCATLWTLARQASPSLEFSIHGVLQARTPEWVAMPSSMGTSRPRNWTCVFCVSLHWQHWATWKASRRIKPTHSRESAKYRREWRCCSSLYRHFIVSVWMKTSLCVQVIRLKTGWKEWQKLLTFVEHSKHRIDEIVSLQYACPCVGGGVGGSYIKLTMTDFVLLIWK